MTIFDYYSPRITDAYRKRAANIQYSCARENELIIETLKKWVIVLVGVHILNKATLPDSARRKIITWRITIDRKRKKHFTYYYYNRYAPESYNILIIDENTHKFIISAFEFKHADTSSSDALLLPYLGPIRDCAAVTSSRRDDGSEIVNTCSRSKHKPLYTIWSGRLHREGISYT